MKIGKRVFLPEAVPTAATILLLALFAGLGLWQLHRAEEKNALAARVEERKRLAPVNLNAIDSVDVHPETIMWRRATMYGTWDDSLQVLLDNQVMDGEVGYFVYTVVLANESSFGVLVNRGWVSAGSMRSTVPDIRVDGRKIGLSGMIAPPPQVGLFQGKDDSPESVAPGVLRVQSIDIRRLGQQLGTNLQPFTVRLDPTATDGYRREWKATGSGADRNKAYAMQWFLLSITTLVVYISLSLKRV